MERDREIGISEYAPGVEIIADGKLFRSGAVWYKSKEPDIRRYVTPNVGHLKQRNLKMKNRRRLAVESYLLIAFQSFQICLNFFQCKVFEPFFHGDPFEPFFHGDPF